MTTHLSSSLKPSDLHSESCPKSLVHTNTQTFKRHPVEEKKVVLDLHARVQVERLLHQLVRAERDRHHRDRAQIVDRHAPVQALPDAVLPVDDGQRAEHAHAAWKRSKKSFFFIIFHKTFSFKPCVK